MEWTTPGGSWAEGETAGLHLSLIHISYIKQELVICFSKRDRREIGYAHIARQHLDHIFGVHDNETSMFGRRDVYKRQPWRPAAGRQWRHCWSCWSR